MDSPVVHSGYSPRGFQTASKVLWTLTTMGTRFRQIRSVVPLSLMDSFSQVECETLNLLDKITFSPPGQANKKSAAH